MAIFSSLSRDSARALGSVKEFLPFSYSEKLKSLLLGKKATVSFSEVSTSFGFGFSFPVFHSITEEGSVNAFIEVANRMILEKSFERWFRKFSANALGNITQLIAGLCSNVSGQVPDFILNALALAIFSQEPFHMLIISDRDSPLDSLLAELDSLLFGFSAFYAEEASEKDAFRQALSQSDESALLIHSLRELKDTDVELLFDAMEYSLIPESSHIEASGDSGKQKKPARRKKCTVSVIARLVPSLPARFINSKEQLLEQIPKPELMAGAFHFPIILNQKPKPEELIAPGSKKSREPAKSPDFIFAREYIDYCRARSPYFPESLEEALSALFLKLKEKEPESLFPINEKILAGMIRLSKSFARLELKNEVRQKHIDFVFSLFDQVLFGNPK